MRIISRHLGVSPQAARRSEAEVRAVFGEVAQRLSDGRPYLCGVHALEMYRRRRR